MFCCLKDKETKKMYVDHKNQQFYFPEEAQPHEATWLQWPHKYTYGKSHHEKLEPIWIQMTEALRKSEIVRIIAYNEQQKQHIRSVLKSCQNVEFFIYETDDVWVRDNGPVFIRNKKTHQLLISNWGFNGWGKKTNYSKCCKIPKKISKDLNFPLIDLREEMVNQGGSVECDGKGTMICCKSSILNNNRNRGLSKKDAEQIFYAYYGVKKIIWLDGVVGQDITDCHIDGFLKFADSQTILTFSEEDLDYWGISERDTEAIYSATSYQNKKYNVVKIPLTKHDVKGKQTRRKKNLGKGSYLNFYIANKVVLVPIYGDPNDQIALKMISEFYPNRQVVGIKINDLFADGGMIHCVTQQQPLRNM